MSVLTAFPILAAVALWSVGFTASTGTEVRAEVAPHFSQEGMGPGDLLPGGTLLLCDGDAVVFEAVLDD
jgi:hypothetical protein